MSNDTVISLAAPRRVSDAFTKLLRTGARRRIEVTVAVAAMHLHGYHFRPVDSGGAAGPLRDTVLMDPDETLRIAFGANNPGDWLLHCHMLEHSVAGMLTWSRVA